MILIILSIIYLGSLLRWFIFGLSLKKRLPKYISKILHDGTHGFGQSII
jgi:hypothetical protein